MDQQKHNSFNFKSFAWFQFKKNKPALVSLYVLGGLMIVALLAPILSNDMPLMAKYKGNYLFPAFSFSNAYQVTDPVSGSKERIQLDIADWKRMELDQVIWAPIPYSPEKSDLLNADWVAPGGDQWFKDVNGEVIDMPGRFRHVMGTNKRGEDVIAGLIHGTRVSLTIGILSMGIATLLGILLGALSGYFGDVRLTTSRGHFWTFTLGVLLAYYYGFFARSFALADAIAESGSSLIWAILHSLIVFMVVLAASSLIGKYWIAKLPGLKKRVFIPVDSIISRLIEILISMPRLILIITIAAIAKPSMVNLMIIIGLTSWTGIARLTRAEFLKIRNLEYIHAGQALGFSEFRVIFRHALPNGIAPALIAIAFGIASAILIESSLSFLGVGVPPDLVTWGSLLFSGREHFDAWWLVVFPGIAIFVTVTVYNLLGEGLRDALDPKQKQ